MEILHISAECYPVAKAGGLGDVVGALPKYQVKAGHAAKVVMPMYRTKFLYENEWDVDFKSSYRLGPRPFDYTIIKERHNKLGFDLYLVDIYGLLDRERIYGYADDNERFIAFQIAVTHWLSHWAYKPDVIHCHDHQAALVPFMMKYCYDFNYALGNVRSVLTIHNAQYQGWLGWDKSYYIPRYDSWKTGLLDWQKNINALACGIKCADRVTTVSPSYMNELRYAARGLESLFEYEKGKCIGILNGIDVDVWDPATDPYIDDNYNTKTVAAGKAKSKKKICAQFGLDVTKPLIVFIGRLVSEKAAEILPDSIRAALHATGNGATFMILGSGESDVEYRLQALTTEFADTYNVVIGYNEKLSHLMYAGADFLLMPSRVEPCGLNQMYAMRYGTVPIVRSTGGLIDTVIDMGDPGGYGIRFIHPSVQDVVHAVTRAVEVYGNSDTITTMRKTMMNVDNSWDKSSQQYIDIYESL